MKPIPITPSALRQGREKMKEKSKRNAFRRAAHHPITDARGPLPDFELYQLEGCPKSHQVRRKLTELGLDYVARVPRSGVYPLLVDHRSGVKLRSANEIEAYLNASYGHLYETKLSRLVHRVRDRVEGRADRMSWKLKHTIEVAKHVPQDVRDTIETVRGAVKILKTGLKRTAS
jgi:hypothetical protein